MQRNTDCYHINKALDFGQYKGLSIGMVVSGFARLPNYWIQETLKDFFENSPETRFKPFGFNYTENYSLDFIKQYLILCSHSPVASGGILGDGHSELKEFFDKELRWNSNSAFKPKPIKLYDKKSGNHDHVLPTGDPQYIEWLIRNVDSFFTYPGALIEFETYSINRWLGFDLERVNDEVFLVKPAFETFRFCFSEEAHSLNEKKFNLSEQLEQQLRDYESSDDYRTHGGPSDGYGGRLDDDFIDDAFGGEADAYWNID